VALQISMMFASTGEHATAIDCNSVRSTINPNPGSRIAKASRTSSSQTRVSSGVTWPPYEIVSALRDRSSLTVNILPHPYFIQRYAANAR
jgi:hypothetical protein